MGYNLRIAEQFSRMAQLLEIEGANPFRIRAYEKAALNLESLNEDVVTLIAEERLTAVPGIGQDLAAKIREILNTGSFQALRELEKKMPETLIELLRIPGVGPRSVSLFYGKLGIKSVEDLEKAAKSGTLLGLPGIQAKTVDNILKGIALLRQGRERMGLYEAKIISRQFIEGLRNSGLCNFISVAGSLRRGRETIRDIDILVTSQKADELMEVFTGLEGVKEVIAKGPTKSSVLTEEDIQVDLRVVETRSLGAALLYFTGSKDFNVRLRQLAIKQGLKVNEYGVFTEKGKQEAWKAGRSEEEVFKFLGLSFIEPELREDKGEIEAALEGRLPKLVAMGDIRGDLHVHSSYSDGNHTMSEVVGACRRKGYQYVLITDHSQGLKVARGLNYPTLEKKRKEVALLNSRLEGFRILFGTEVDIDSDGKLDYPDKVLAEFDIVVAAIHSGFKQSPSQITRRLVRACGNPYVHIIAHPTGRLLGARAPYDFDREEVFKTAAMTGTAMEISAFSQRLDLNDRDARMCKERGVRLSLGTDTHILDQLEMMELGVVVARRGWLEKYDLLNCLSGKDLVHWARAKKERCRNS